jgi:hypothetical protein
MADVQIISQNHARVSHFGMALSQTTSGKESGGRKVRPRSRTPGQESSATVRTKQAQESEGFVN